MAGQGREKSNSTLLPLKKQHLAQQSNGQKKRDPVSVFLLALAFFVFLIFMFGVIGVIMFLNQDYERAVMSTNNAKAPPLSGSAAFANKDFSGMVDARGCCLKHSLSCIACKKGISSRLLCMKAPSKFAAECPTIESVPLSGNGELIRAKNGRILDATHLTISAWVRSSLGQRRVGTVVSNRVNSCSTLSSTKDKLSQYGYALKVSEYGQLILTIGGLNRPCISLFSSADVVPMDQWVHVGFTLDENEQSSSGFSASLFANGVEVASLRGGESRPIPRFRSTMNIFHIGSSSDGLEPFVGYISNVQVYHGAFRSALIWPSPRRPVQIGEIPQLIQPFLLLHYNMSIPTSALIQNETVLIQDFSGTGRDGMYMSSNFVRDTEVLHNDLVAFESATLSTLSTSTSPLKPRFSEKLTSAPTSSDQEVQQGNKEISDEKEASSVKLEKDHVLEKNIASTKVDVASTKADLNSPVKATQANELTQSPKSTPVEITPPEKKSEGKTPLKETDAPSLVENDMNSNVLSTGAVTNSKAVEETAPQTQEEHGDQRSPAAPELSEDDFQEERKEDGETDLEKKTNNQESPDLLQSKANAETSSHTTTVGGDAHSPLKTDSLESKEDRSKVLDVDDEIAQDIMGLKVVEVPSEPSTPSGVEPIVEKEASLVSDASFSSVSDSSDGSGNEQVTKSDNHVKETLSLSQSNTKPPVETNSGEDLKKKVQLWKKIQTPKDLELMIQSLPQSS